MYLEAVAAKTFTVIYDKLHLFNQQFVQNLNNRDFISKGILEKLRKSLLGIFVGDGMKISIEEINKELKRGNPYHYELKSIGNFTSEETY